MKKLRLQPALVGLTPDQQEQLAEWLDSGTYDKAIELAARPAPEGLGRTLSRGVLQRFYKKVEDMRELFEERVAFQVALREYFALANGEPTSLDPEGLRIIKERAFELALQKDQTPAKLKDPMRIFDYDRRVQLENNREARADRRDTRAQAMLDIAREKLVLAQNRVSKNGSRRGDESLNPSSND